MKSRKKVWAPVLSKCSSQLVRKTNETLIEGFLTLIFEKMRFTIILVAGAMVIPQGNIETLRKTKLTLSLGGWHYVHIFYGLQCPVHAVCIYDLTSTKSTYVNLLTPINDQNRISLYNINTISTRWVMRIKKNINLGMISWSNTKFSELTL